MSIVSPIYYQMWSPVLAHVAAWEPYNLRDLTHVSWVGSVPYRSHTACQNKQPARI